MPRIAILSVAVAASLMIGPPAWGQSLLDKVEQRVKKPIDRATDPTPGEPGTRRVPAPDEPAPAEAPRLRGDDLPPVPDADAPTSGYLGVVLEDVPGGGIRVLEVAKDSPAAKAGLKEGDKVTAVNKALVKDIEELGSLMEPVPPGGKLTLTVERDGKESTIEATLGEPPLEPARRDPDRIELGGPLGPGASELPPPAASDAPRAGGAAQRASLGITVVTFNEELRRRSDVPARSGAMVTQIRPESPAARAGLPVGGVIVAYDGQRIDSAEELVEAIRASRPGDEVELTYYQGGALRRKDVKLAAAADPSLLGPGYGGLLRDRPLLGRVERAIDGLTRPGEAPGAAPGDDPSAPVEAASLREEIDALKAKVETLESRLAELEAKLGAERPAPDAGAVPAIENPGEAAPVVPRGAAPATSRPPTLRPPRNPAGAKIGDE